MGTCICFKNILFAAGLVFFLFAKTASADAVGQTTTFNVDSSFDATSRSQVNAELIKSSDKIDFYVEKNWWDAQPADQQAVILQNLDQLSQEFDNHIYPTLTGAWGLEWQPQTSDDNKMTVFFELMNLTEGGYFREADEYPTIQIPTSNQRQMVYLSLDNITSVPILERVLAHEFTHVIIFNQKNKIYGVEEDTWLNEAMSDYASTLLGYDDVYAGSNLQERANDFLADPTDSITEWQGAKYDYASVSMFTHYLVDQYGINILEDALHSKYVGIASINYALQKDGVNKTFSQIFTDWTVALVVNDCSVGKQYCYTDPDLASFRLPPSLNFLPVSGNVSLSVTNVTKSWSGNWLKFIGGNGDLKMDFSSLQSLPFQVPYVLTDSSGIQTVGSFTLDKNDSGEIDVPNFGTDYQSLTIIPTLQLPNYQVTGLEPTYPFTYTVNITGAAPVTTDSTADQLLEKIASLKVEIANLQGSASGQVGVMCSALNNNLSVGMAHNSDVTCLQEFLKSQGSGIYPSGLVTGNFGSLTKAAVIKFQEEFSDAILTPLGLSQGTGYVGPSTRAQINTILSDQ